MSNSEWKEVQIPGDVRGSVVKVDASAPISINTINKGSCSAYKALPLSHADIEYRIVTWAPTAGGRSAFSVASVSDGNLVEIRLSGASTDTVQIGHTDPIPMGTGVFLLPANTGQFVTIYSSGDLSGSTITSTDPIVVFAGNLETPIGTGALEDQTLTQFPPVKTWGMHFVVGHIPESEVNGYYLKVISQLPSTKVEFLENGKLTELLIRSPASFILYEGRAAVYVEAQLPIEIVQYVKSPEANRVAVSAPASLYIPPIEQAKHTYLFTITPDNIYRR